jgi:hypothetical protein
MSSSLSNLSDRARNLPKTDWLKIMSTSLVAIVMLVYCVMGYLKNRKYNKMLEKAAGGKDSAAALKGKLLPDDLRKKIGDVAGFSLTKAIMTFFLTLVFVATMSLMP